MDSRGTAISIDQNPQFLTYVGGEGIPRILINIKDGNMAPKVHLEAPLAAACRFNIYEMDL